MSNVKKFSVMIRSEVLEAVVVLAESELQAHEFACFIHDTNPELHLVDRLVVEAEVLTELPLAELATNESGDR